MDGEMMLAGIDWRELAPDRLVNVLSALLLREYAAPRETLQARERLRMEFEDPDTRAEVEAVRDAEVYDARLDESGLPVGLAEAPRG